MKIERFHVYLARPAQSARTHAASYPCVVVSPDELNQHIATVIVAPLVPQGRWYPSRVACQVQGQQGQIVLDQLRTIEKQQLVRELDSLDSQTQQAVVQALTALFAA